MHHLQCCSHCNMTAAPQHSPSKQRSRPTQEEGGQKQRVHILQRRPGSRVASGEYSRAAVASDLARADKHGAELPCMAGGSALAEGQRVVLMHM